MSERVLIETATYQSKTWEYNQANHTEFRLTKDGGNTFSIVTYTNPKTGDETLHGTQEDICALIAELGDMTYEESEGRHLAFYHNGHGDYSAEDAINPIEFFADQAENDRQVADLKEDTDAEQLFLGEYAKSHRERQDFFDREIALARVHDYDLKNMNWKQLTENGLRLYP